MRQADGGRFRFDNTGKANACSVLSVVVEKEGRVHDVDVPLLSK